MTHAGWHLVMAQSLGLCHPQGRPGIHSGLLVHGAPALGVVGIVDASPLPGCLGAWVCPCLLSLPCEQLKSVLKICVLKQKRRGKSRKEQEPSEAMWKYFCFEKHSTNQQKQNQVSVTTRAAYESEVNSCQGFHKFVFLYQEVSSSSLSQSSLLP